MSMNETRAREILEGYINNNNSLALMRRVDELEAWQREAVKILQMVRQDEMLFAACNGLDEHEPSTVCILIAQAKTEEVGR